MERRWSAEQTERELVRFVQPGIDLVALGHGLTERISRHVPLDGSCWHTMDPATTIFTTGYTEGFDAEVGFPLLVANEFFVPDFNKFRDLGRAPRSAASLVQATEGRIERSPRYASLLRIYGAVDELRAVFRIGGAVWGALVASRDGIHQPFTKAEVDFFVRIGPLVASAYRRALVSGAATTEGHADGPGLVIMSADGAIESMTPAGERWMEELGLPVGESHRHAGYGTAVRAVDAMARAAGLGRLPASMQPRLRLRTMGGDWLVLHASLLDGRADGRVAIILEPARPAEVAAILLEGYGLTPRERDVVSLVLQGRSTQEMAAELGLSPYTVQDHLKSIFSKFGVSSRSELVGRVFQRDYLPRINEAPVAADGFFAG
jgi:DNA-binding CsgD family transcriptional regulator